MDSPTNAVASHIVVVAASRAAAAPGLPLLPLQFEGARGWKGPSPTSAFRRVSPRRSVESDNTLVVGGTHSSPERRRQDVFDFDLNKAYSADDEMANLIPGKQILVEEGPKRSERLKLDLNRSSDNDDAPSDSNVEGQIFDHKNSHISPPPSSSPSSMSRNIDLNDQPFFCNDSSNLQPHCGKSSFPVNLNGSEGIKSGDSVISIMGTRVEVNRKDFIPQPPSLPNGRIVEPSLDSNMARRGGFSAKGNQLPYACPPAFGYNPYVVRSRGASVGTFFCGVNSQPSLDSGGVGKRKEPEGGLEPYPFEYKHQPQWE